MEEIIKLLVRPGSNSNSIEGAYQDRIKIKIKSPPERGRANKELIKFLSEKTGIPKKNIKILSGLNTSLKDIKIIKKIDENIYSKLLKTDANSTPSK